MELAFDAVSDLRSAACLKFTMLQIVVALGRLRCESTFFVTCAGKVQLLVSETRSLAPCVGEA